MRMLLQRLIIFSWFVCISFFSANCPAQASELLLQGQERWVVLAARQTIDEAVAFAKGHPGARIVTNSSNDWFVIIIGPERVDKVEEYRAKQPLWRRFSIPRDAYLSNGARFVEQVWPRPDFSNSYKLAESAFGKLSLRQQHELQMLLAATGHWNAVSGDRFSKRLYNAITRFEVENGAKSTGIPTPGLFTNLRMVASPILIRWNLRLVIHPVSGTRLWVPRGLLSKTLATEAGLKFTSDRDPVAVFFSYFRQINIHDAYIRSLSIRSDEVISYKIQRDDFFVVVSDNKDNLRTYTRYQSIPGGLVGYALVWRHGEDFHGDRLATIMSDLFRSTVSLSLSMEPPRPIEDVQTAKAPSTAKSPSVQSTQKSTSVGTSFVVSEKGHFVTNSHVVENCTKISVSLARQVASARIVARDERNDLALLVFDIKPSSVAVLRAGLRLGEDVAVFGFPLSGILASGGNFTRGNITALAGVRDDSRFVQISAPVQPGNSGGPLLDESGLVVGMVVSKLNALKVAAATDDIPQNINFAINGNLLMNFLSANGVTFQTAIATLPISPPEIAERTGKFTAAVECRR